MIRESGHTRTRRKDRNVELNSRKRRSWIPSSMWRLNMKENSRRSGGEKRNYIGGRRWDPTSAGDGLLKSEAP